MLHTTYHMEILGVRVDNLSKDEILEKIEEFLDEEKFHQIVTVNPEFILEAQKNTEFRQILHRSDLNIADGIGIKYAFLRYRSLLKARFSGADLILDILKMAENKKLGVFLAINKDGLSSFEEIKVALLKTFPNLLILGEDIDPTKTNYKLQTTNHELLLCNFGAPSQEMFINSQKNATIRIAIGVGGSFDFLTGKVKRAPLWMRKIGLEWLWRIAVQPQNKLMRLRRIFNAVAIFSIKVLLDRKKTRS